MTLAQRIAACRAQGAQCALEEQGVWWAELQGLLIGGGLQPDAGVAFADPRMQAWFTRGLEDSRILTLLEAVNEKHLTPGRVQV